MKFLLLCSLWLVGAGSVAAYNSQVAEPSAPYEPFLVSESYSAERVYLGTLEGYPDMFEIVSAEKFNLVLALDTLSGEVSAPALSVIVVSVDESGVAEVMRLPYTAAEWELRRQSATGLRLLTGPVYETELPAGLYRIEISTPDNIGKYLLTLGKESSGVGYFTTLRSIAQAYQFAGKSTWGMVRSSYVQIPLAMLLVLLLLGATWRWRKLILA